jgi:subtilisin family serine protease
VSPARAAATASCSFTALSRAGGSEPLRPGDSHDDNGDSYFRDHRDDTACDHHEIRRRISGCRLTNVAEEVAMHLERNDAMSRLLDRHPTVEHVAGSAGQGTLIRRSQLLVSARDAAEVEARTARWLDRRDDDEQAGIAVLRLRPGVDVCEIAAGLSGDAPHRTLSAGPNHILTAAPNWRPGPADDPIPAAAIAGPPPVQSGRRTVNVAVLDTGISAHPWFTGREWFGSCGPEVIEVPDANHDDRLDSVAGHGTFIAGVVAMQAPSANLTIGKVIAGDGVTDELRLLRGLAQLRAHAHEHRTPVDVVSLSLGCYTHDNRPSPVLEQGLHRFGHETAIVACAGNFSSDRPYWPAALKRVLAVASLNTDGTDRAEFSNFGWWVDACTLGDGIVSSFFSFDGPAEGSSNPEDFTGYATWSGTSFAAPRVAGAIAARAAEHGISAAAAAAALLDASDHSSMPDLGVLVDPRPEVTPESSP